MVRLIVVWERGRPFRLDEMEILAERLTDRLRGSAAFTRVDLQRLAAPALTRVRVLDGWILELDCASQVPVEDALAEPLLEEAIDDLRLMDARPSVAITGSPGG